MSSITWTDATGTATLSNGKPAPGNRFSGWTPRSAPFGPRAEALGTGIPYIFPFRDDHSAMFDIVGIPNSSMALMLRLQYHLLNGGTVTVATADAAARTYSTCVLAPGSGEPQITLTDRENLEYTMRLNLLNVAVVRIKMECVY